jgi:RNA polymerase sigma factor (sigma-70 family)
LWGQVFWEVGVVADPQLHNVLHHLRRAVGAPDAGDSDGSLLRRFVGGGDAAAFELIVWRHERMVRGVCRRLLGDSHDADDAFQVTFLVLVRKAHSVGNGPSLASWLYKVAYRCALRLRTTATGRREVSGADLAAVPAPEGHAAEQALGPLLDEELQALPDKYRAPLVLCYLEGRTYDEAARLLGCPKGTVSTRLTRGRDLLRRRLARRGVGLPAAALAAVLCTRAASAAPLGLVPATVGAAVLVAAGGAVPAHLTAVAEGVLRSMFLSKIKTASVVLFALALLGMGTGAMLRPGRAETAPGDAPAPASAAERVYRRLFTRTDQDGKPYDQEELEPPFAPGSKFLTDGESHRQALAALDDFLKGEPEKKMTPLQRAVLQRDLWAVLATTAGGTRERMHESARGRIERTRYFEDGTDAGLERPRQRRELQKRLVAAMRRTALSPREIAALPNNLADALKAAAFPREFDPRHPERAFLPPDLADADGPWLGFANWLPPDGLAVPEHTAFVKGRSVFTVRLRLPGGREATQAYLKNAAKGDVSQFPVGTQIALLRRMLLIDETGTPRPTRLTESVELRYYRKPERGDQPIDVGAPAVFVLSRKDLVAGRNGGLRPVGHDEAAPYSFQARGRLSDADPLEQDRRVVKAQPLIQMCGGCHERKTGYGGIHTVNTVSAGERGEPQGLLPATDDEQEQATIRWLRKTYTWGLVQGMWESRPAGE